MRKRLSSSKLSLILGLLIASALILSIFPAGGWSQTPEEICSAPTMDDHDEDGFPDFYECTTLQLISPLIDGNMSISGYDHEIPDRSQWLHPTEADLFSILVPESGGHIPCLGPGTSGLCYEPMECLTRAETEGGLGFGVHFLDANFTDTNRYVSQDLDQKAVRVAEDMDTNGVELGIATYGTPNYYDRCTVYTQRILNHIEEIISGASEVRDINDDLITDPNQLRADYIKHVTAHEVGHMLCLTHEYNRKAGGYHWLTGTEFHLDQSVKYTDKGGKVRIYLPIDYRDISQVERKLK